MNPRVFREYDIRGNADRDLDDAFAGELGKAIGTHLKRAGAKRITVGRDCRVTSPRLHKALRAGILSTGVSVIDVGIVATPMLYFSVFHFDGRASHCDVFGKFLVLVLRLHIAGGLERIGSGLRTNVLMVSLGVAGVWILV